MKRLLLLCAIVLLASCSSTNGSSSGTGSSKIEGWSSGFKGAIKFYTFTSPITVLATLDVGTDGTFDLSLPTPIGSQLFTSITKLCYTGLAMTPITSSFSLPIPIAFIAGGTFPQGVIALTNRVIGSIPDNAKVGDIAALPIYFSDDSKIVGTCTSKAYNSPTIIYNYNASFSAGWNYLQFVVTGINPLTITATGSRNVSTGLSWHLLSVSALPILPSRTFTNQPSR